MFILQGTAPTKVGPVKVGGEEFDKLVEYNNAFRSLQTLQGRSNRHTEALFKLELNQILAIMVIWLHKLTECHGRYYQWLKFKVCTSTGSNHNLPDSLLQTKM